METPSVVTEFGNSVIREVFCTGRIRPKENEIRHVGIMAA